ncbi:MAG: branched-chain amino acid ABC transporter permease [Anaerolineae bacterium]
MSPTFISMQFLNGITFASLLFLLASGFTFIFGLMRIINLAHGGFYLLGGYIGITVLVATGNFWLAILSAAIGVAIFGVVIERFLLRFVRGKILPEVLLTVGLSFIIADGCLAIFGGNPRTLLPPKFLAGTVELGLVTYPWYRLFVVFLSLVIGIALWYLQEKTRLGAIVRAGVDDAEMVAALGINIKRIFTTVFFLGAALAGLSGVAGSAVLALYPGVDAEILTYGLVVVIIGGLGSLPGAVAGSLFVGLVDTFGKALFPEISYFTVFAPMAIMLAVRPRGLFGRE